MRITCIFISKLFAVFLVTLLFHACARDEAIHNEHLSQIKPNDPPWIVQFKQTLGHKWYEVKLFDVSVGRACKERHIITKDNSIFYQILHDEELSLQIYGTTNRTRIHQKKIFASTPPYNMVSYEYVEVSGNSERSLHIEPDGNQDFTATLKHNDSNRSEALSDLPYTLEDELELELWAKSATQISEEKYLPQLLQLFRFSLPLKELKATIHSIYDEQYDGKQKKIARVAIEYNNSTYSFLDFDESGVLLSKASQGFYKYYYKEKLPAPPTNETDLYVHNMIPITQKIGKPENINRLYLKIEGPNSELIENGPMQNVTYKGEDKSALITLQRDSDLLQEKNDPENIDKYIKLPHIEAQEQEAMRNMAHNAVGDTILTEERIERLVKYVDEYIHDEYIFDSNLQQLLKGKKGDCSEHAMLFSILARSLGIPCREVSGLVYMGDWCKGFGLHAWNEVYVNNQWKSVDASIGSSNLFPIYIRFPDTMHTRNALMNSAHKIMISVTNVESIHAKNNQQQ